MGFNNRKFFGVPPVELGYQLPAQGFDYLLGYVHYTCPFRELRRGIANNGEHGGFKVVAVWA